jgi:hypothetical protein
MAYLPNQGATGRRKPVQQTRGPQGMTPGQVFVKDGVAYVQRADGRTLRVTTTTEGS